MMYMIAILIGWYEFPTDCPSALQPITAQHLVRDKNGYWHLVYIDQDSVIYAFSNTEGSYWTKERIAGGSNEWLRCGVALIDKPETISDLYSERRCSLLVLLSV